ncbi:MAG: DegT/DnrJ/EryC1/StrS family aminotransferase [Candidatus Flexifilum sp.]
MLVKNPVPHLAILGGQPAFAEPLHVGRPNIGNRERLMARINDILDRRWFTNNGRYVQEFEARLAEFTGVKHAVAMTNATIAQEIAVRAAGITGEVIIPSFTFVATAHALQWQEITPVFCDVAPGTHHIDPNRVEELITPRTTAIIGVHVWGAPCAIDALSEIASRRGLHLMFDAAHAIGCSYRGRMIGGFGEAEIVSFHATKFLNSFEGGAVLTNDDALATRMRFMRNFGFAGYDDVDYVGTNGKMTEVAAAMGLTSLESIDEIVAINQRNYRAYQSGLEGLPGIRLFTYDETERNNFQYIIVEVDEEQAGISRDLLVRVLHAENVLARRYFYPGCHQMEPYRSYYPHARLLLPETEKLTQRVMSLPTGTAVDEQTVGMVCAIIRAAVANHREIRQHVH